MVLFLSGFLLLLLFVLITLLYPFFKNPLRSFLGEKLWILLVLIGGSVLLYLYWGSPQAQIQYGQREKEEATIRQSLSQYPSVAAVEKRLREALHQKPNSAKGWYLLGKLYLSEEKQAEALQAFSRAHALEPRNEIYLLAYAESYFTTHGNRLSEFLRSTLGAIFKEHPDEVVMGNLLALDAYHRGDHEGARHYWESLLPLFEAGSEDEGRLLEMIAKTQN